MLILADRIDNPRLATLTPSDIRMFLVTGLVLLAVPIGVAVHRAVGRRA